MAPRCPLVDEDPDFLASASALLTAQGLDVVGQATAAWGAVPLVEELNPAAVLVDVELGADDGIELARRLGEDAAARRIVLISLLDLSTSSS